MNSLKVDIEKQYDSFSLDAHFETTFERLGIIGPSGSGKSTLADLIAGHQFPDNGSILFNDRTFVDPDTNRVIPRHERNVGYLLQDAPLLPHLSIRENLRYPPRTELDTKPAGPIVDILGITDLLDQNPREISGGERRRAALAQVLLSQPELLILDEPVVGLNEAMKRSIVPRLRKVLDTVQQPLIVISHEPEIVRALCNKGLTIRGGITSEILPIQQIFENQDTRTRAGLADSNVFKARVTGEGNNGAVVETETGLEFFISPPAPLESNQTVVLSFPSSEPVLAKNVTGQLSTRNRWSGEIQSIEDVPDGKRVSVHVEDQTFRSRVTQKTVTNMDLTQGESITLLLKSQAIDILPT
ncbi:MAG: ATP-binding cassette domain-containing protein [bacterium]